ncbi:MFS transporter [Kitasatospora sp. NPDC127111]|uniref:MFS transporter n=1 Tax=Kitasatospora sp. NPDC127111 TaxID=3345363 RepID=UPI00362E653F
MGRARARARVVAGFGVFGMFWGTWGALVPEVQARTRVGDGGLGVAVLMIGLGALCSMRPAGAAVDRYGRWAVASCLLSMAVAAVLVGLATNGPELTAALALLGAASGAVDVAVNAMASAEENRSGRLLNAAHACFSAAVVLGALATGFALGRGAGAGAVLAVVGVLLAGAAGAIGLTPGAGEPGREPGREPEPVPPGPAVGPGGRAADPAVPMAEPAARAADAAALTADRAGRAAASAGSGRGTRSAGAGRGTRPGRAVSRPLLALGLLCALAFLVENAWQSWSAVMLRSVFHLGAGASAAGPVVFAASAAAGRLAGHGLASRLTHRRLLVLGALVAATGTLGAAVARDAGEMLAGLVVAGLGTSVCAPTILSLAGTLSRPEVRSSSLAVVTSAGYAGFLVGPAAVGLAASAAGLRATFCGVAAVALLLALRAVSTEATTTPHPTPPPADSRACRP